MAVNTGKGKNVKAERCHMEDPKPLRELIREIAELLDLKAGGNRLSSMVIPGLVTSNRSVANAACKGFR